MSDEHVEALRQVIQAFQACDWVRMRELLPPEFEYHTSDDFPEGAAIYRGPDAMRRVREFLDEAWAQADIELLEASPVADAVLATMSNRLRLERTGSELPPYTFFQVWRFAGDRPASAQTFQTRAGALRSVGSTQG